MAAPLPPNLIPTSPKLARDLSEAPDAVELVRAASEQAKGLPQPALVRGLTSTPVTDLAALAALVLEAMKADHPDWAALTPDSLAVKDVSGHGGAKTFKVSPTDPSAALHPPAVALHSRPVATEHGFMRQTPEARSLFMRRMSAGTQAVAAGGVGPRRLAEGPDWFLEVWEAKGQPDCSSPEAWARVGALAAKLHEVPTDWFEPYRAEMLLEYPGAKAVPRDSPAWIFLARGLKFAETCPFGAWGDMGPLAPRHPAAARVVTCHGDLHPGNLIEHADGRLEVVDFEFIAVATAALDLAFGVACCGGNKDHRRAFLAAYLEATGHAADDDAIDELAVDAYLAVLYLWHSGGKLAGWELPEDAGRAEALVEKCKAFAEEVRASPALRENLLAKRLDAAMREHPLFEIGAELADSPWYLKVQAKLDLRPPGHRAAVGVAPLADAPEAFVLRPARDQSLALQVRPGTARLELAAADGSSNQQWVAVGAAAEAAWHGVQVQHVATGLCLATAVKYPIYRLGAPWETTGTELFVRPSDPLSPDQRWSLDHPDGLGVFLRHALDGRVLDVNAWELTAGVGVNVVAAFATGKGQLWVRERVAGAEAPSASLPPAEHFAQLKARGGVYQCWRIEMLKTKEQVVQHNYADGTFAAFPLESDEKEGEGTWTMADGAYVEHSNDPCSGTLLGDAEAFRMEVDCGPYGPAVFTPASECYDRGFRRDLGAGGAEELRRRAPKACAVDVEADTRWAAPSSPIADVAGEFLIQPGAAPGLCLAVRADGYTKDPHEVYLQAVQGDTAAQRWRLVGLDRLQHVATGLFLHTETKYPVAANVNAPWAGNHTNLVLRPEDGSDRQRWVLGPDEFHGGKVLRHFKDCRGVDVHGWRMQDGNNMGCENSTHSDCRGVSFVFTAVS